MFGILKNEALVQPVAGCYSNEIHYKEVSAALKEISTAAEDATRDLLKNFWIRNCEIIRERERGQAASKQLSAKEKADKLLAFTKMRALNRITGKHSAA
jgi:hypothetical protein